MNRQATILKCAILLLLLLLLLLLGPPPSKVARADNNPVTATERRPSRESNVPFHKPARRIGPRRDRGRPQDHRQEHKPLIQIARSEMTPAREVVPSGLAGHGHDKFDSKDNLGTPDHRQGFRAQGTTAELTVSDWKSPDKPGGAAG